MSNEQEVARYVARHPTFAPYAAAQATPCMGLGYRMAASQLPTPEQIAGAFLDDADFQALRLGSWLGSPDGEFFAQAVALAIPAEYEPIFNLAVASLKLASDTQMRNDRKAAAGFVIAAFVLAAVIVWSE
ncbi:MAG: hypothetical protein M0T77_02780 [Actinomycetota bacterium]|nr:hypothetical protein [Actinomycetota bacterium]